MTNFGGGTTAGAEAARLVGLRAGRACVDLHTSVFPGGEIRRSPLGIFEDGFESRDPLSWSSSVGWS